MAKMLGELTQMGSGRGFDILRIAAAVGVLVSHAFPLTGRKEPVSLLTGHHWNLGAFGVAVFFCVSGFLIAMSADRTNSVLRFTEKRLLRILPALFVVVFLSVFVLGPLLTTENIRSYFSHLLTWRYLGLAFFLPSTGYLPGVFESNLFPRAVNGSLWTLRYEIACYAILGFGRYFVGSTQIIYPVLFLGCGVYELITGGNLMSPVHLATFFFCGATSYVLREWVPIKGALAGLAVILILAVAFTSSDAIFMAIPMTYIALAVGYFGPRLKIIRHHDISYGLYLYAFPVQQIVSNFVHASPVLDIIVSLPIVIVCASLSWMIVEKRAKAIKFATGSLFSMTKVLDR